MSIWCIAQSSLDLADLIWVAVIVVIPMLSALGEWIRNRGKDGQGEGGQAAQKEWHEVELTDEERAMLSEKRRRMRGGKESEGELVELAEPDRVPSPPRRRRSVPRRQVDPGPASASGQPTPPGRTIQDVTSPREAADPVPTRSRPRRAAPPVRSDAPPAAPPQPARPAPARTTQSSSSSRSGTPQRQDQEEQQRRSRSTAGASSRSGQGESARRSRSGSSSRSSGSGSSRRPQTHTPHDDYEIVELAEQTPVDSDAYALYEELKLQGFGLSDLRRAVILSEVLRPPLAERHEDPYEPI
jgi:uncharacterized membrane protein YgcG